MKEEPQRKEENQREGRRTDPILVVFNVKVDVRVEEILSVLFISIRGSNEAPQWQLVCFSITMSSMNKKKIKKKKKKKKNIRRRRRRRKPRMSWK